MRNHLPPTLLGLSCLIASWSPALDAQAATTPDNSLLIITHSSFQNSSTALWNFIAHKQAMGWTVCEADEYTWAGQTGLVGDAAAQRLRAYLQAYYPYKYAYRKYLLIIGDPDMDWGNVPMKRTWPYWFGASLGTDYYYADLRGPDGTASSWDLNGNGNYGELGDFGTGGIDTVPEMIVGRIPFYGDVAEVDSILQKIINYEDAFAVDNWVEKVLLPMSPEDAYTPNWPLGEAIKASVCSDSQNRKCTRIYDDSYVDGSGRSVVPDVSPTTEDNVLGKWLEHYGFVFWESHGGDTYAEDLFSTDSVPSLDDNYPAFVFQSSCDTGRPTNPDNLAFALLKNGAIATVAATDMTGYGGGTGDVTNTDNEQGLAYRYAVNLVRLNQRCGDAFWNMMTQVPRTDGIWNNHLGFVLYGDPTVRPRVGTRRVMYGNDDRGYTGDGDWAPGYWKGECAATDVLVGASRSTTQGAIHDVLCKKFLYTPNAAAGSTLVFTTRDSRRDTSTGDWDPGYVKGECGYFEAVTGLAQTPDNVTRARCAAAAYYGYESCRRRIFWRGDNRESGSGGDWDYGFYKGQCGDGLAYVKGVSKDSSGKIRSLLCCTARYPEGQ